MILNDKVIGERIKNARVACNLTQTEFSIKIHVAQQTLSRYENGISKIPNDVLENIAGELNISLSYFLGVSSEKYSDDELLLIELYRRANEKGKKYIYKLVKLMTMQE